MSKPSIEEFYSFAFNYLKDNIPEKVSKKEFDSYFIPEDKNPKSMEQIARRMFISLQNSNMMPGVIGFEINEAKFARILCNYKIENILKKYNTVDILYKTLKKEFKFKVINDSNNLWRRYAKGVISGCKFLSSFETVNDFKKFVKYFDKDVKIQMALPLLIGKEVYGLGFALACDFLKELGYTYYPKPDTHLIAVFSELGLAECDEASVYKAIVDMAKITGKSSYEVDKKIWLICSGKWHKHEYFTGKKLNVKGLRDEFITEAKKNGYTWC